MDPVNPAAESLIDCVIKAFPALPVSASRIENAGGDHVLLIVNEQYAFRFPRAGMHDLRLEIDVLRLLQRRLVLPTPSYDYVDPAGRFAGYAFIEGVELTPSRFHALSPGAKDQVLADAARFLSELHGLPVEAIGPPTSWRTTWTAAQYADRGLAERLPIIAKHLPTLAAPVEQFYRRYRDDRPDHLVVVHGDLVTEHLLLDERAARLSGIIDFGDVALGDPAQDFLGIMTYGAKAVSRVLESYDPEHEDPGLLGRSRNHFIRYQLDRVAERLNEGLSVNLAQAAATIGAQLELAQPTTGADRPQRGRLAASPR